jgi:hypothetical protein
MTPLAVVSLAGLLSGILDLAHQLDPGRDPACPC